MFGYVIFSDFLSDCISNNMKIGLQHAELILVIYKDGKLR